MYSHRNLKFELGGSKEFDIWSWMGAWMDGWMEELDIWSWTNDGV
jgi:hypothetical protein